MDKNPKPTATAASGAGFTPAERAGGLGGAPLAPPSSFMGRRQMLQGLLAGVGAAIPGAARGRFGQPFKSLSEARQNEVLSAASSGKPGREEWIWTPGTIVKQPEPGPPKTTPRDHFDNLKQWIAGAYYSSEAGMKELGS